MNNFLRTLAFLVAITCAHTAHAGPTEAANAVRTQPYFQLKGDLIPSAVLPGFYALHTVVNPSNPLKGMALGVNEVASVVNAPNGVHRHLTPQQNQFTADEERAFRMAVMRSIDTSGLIKYKFGKGERTLFIVTAYDCPYCVNLEKRLQKVAPKLNATVYLLPLVLNPGADSLPTYNALVCGPNPAEQWRAVMTQRVFPTKPLPNCGAPTLVDTAIAAIALGDVGTPSIFQEDGTKASSAYVNDDAALIRLFTPAGKADLLGPVPTQLRDLEVADAFAETVGKTTKPRPVTAASPPSPSTAPSGPCGPGQIGGIVVSNKKIGSEFVTSIQGDKVPFHTPKNAGAEYTKVSKLKAGDLYCAADDGS